MKALLEAPPDYDGKGRGPPAVAVDPVGGARFPGWRNLAQLPVCSGPTMRRRFALLL
jgi:hypothetical protein